MKIMRPTSRAPLANTFAEIFDYLLGILSNYLKLDGLFDIILKVPKVKILNLTKNEVRILTDNSANHWLKSKEPEVDDDLETESRPSKISKSACRSTEQLATIGSKERKTKSFKIITSKARARARGQLGTVLDAGFKGPSKVRGTSKTQTKAVAAAKPKIGSVTQTKAEDGTVAKTLNTTHTEAFAVTREVEVSKMKAMTKIKLMAETNAKMVTESTVVPQTKSKAMPGSKASVMTQFEVKLGADNKVNIRPCTKANNMASIKSRPQTKDETSIKSRAGNKANIEVKSNNEDEENVCSWFWTGEEPSVGSWFWSEEETPSHVYKPPPENEEKPKSTLKAELSIKEKVAAWSRARCSVLVPIEVEEQSLTPERNWTLVETLIETPLGIQPLTKISACGGPYFQTLAEIKKQIRFREKYRPHPRVCCCKPRGLSLAPKEFNKLITLLNLTKDPFIHEIATMVIGVSSAYPFTQDIIYDVGITVMLENFINNPHVKEHPRALNLVTDSSESSEESKSEESCTSEVCKDTFTYPLNSPVQLSEHLSVKFENHYMIISYIPDFLTLLNKGSVKTKFFVLKVFSYLAKNQANTRKLISAEVLSSLLAAFNKNEPKANILVIIGIFENINVQLKRRVKLFTKEQFTKYELISIFQETKEFGQKLQDLADHNDPEVRDKIIRLIFKL
ncbi:PREDICTED: LOW QUALITY PROTEIN: armadillo repeat-containing X-linked protein 5 [Chrysochloris asiatica]|uniref:LOW QUALITY PROTEIN: armadillo repeat-containing X-linked protein 5 n=1 Tax=Chrysochloris asiatica TaxID=185453 RepID=A0A9B0TWR8_CHRAS|nr:PREDICTED: LOW QUALITY PROTEIN: armadillo repeat-containing X-linked protein 5 [Chrysochloris asiatica]